MAEFLCYFNNYNYIEPVKKKTNYFKVMTRSLEFLRFFS